MSTLIFYVGGFVPSHTAVDGVLRERVRVAVEVQVHAAVLGDGAGEVRACPSKRSGRVAAGLCGEAGRVGRGGRTLREPRGASGRWRGGARRWARSRHVAKGVGRAQPPPARPHGSRPPHPLGGAYCNPGRRELEDRYRAEVHFSPKEH